MTEQYLKERDIRQRNSRVTGVILTILAHGVLLVFGIIAGFTYLNPPPPEKEQILIEFDEFEVKKPKQTWNGSRPQVEKPDPSKPINLVQQSEGQHVGTKTNEAEESVIDDHGDVEVPQPPREKEINRKALFAAADNKAKKDTLAAQTSREVSDALKAGHAQGNTMTGETSGEPNARLAGRSVNGTIARPTYNIQKSGKVVVEIWVDNYGTVQKAIAGAEGTTVTDKTLWQEAYKAAKRTQFNMSADAPAMQKGTITYVFTITGK